MLVSFAILLALHCLLLVVLPESVDALPVRGKPGGEEGKAISKGKEKFSHRIGVPILRKPRKQRGQPAIVGPRKHLPDNYDFSRLSFRDLVDMKPQDYVHDEGQLYKECFERHPVIRKINLQDPEPYKTAQALVALQKHGEDDRRWKLRLSTSVNHLINDTPFKNQHLKSQLQDLVDGHRHEVSKKDRAIKDRWRAAVAIQKLMDQGNTEAAPVEKEYRPRRPKENPYLNLPLSKHFGSEGDHMTALQVEERASRLGNFYTTASVLSKEIEKYLKSKNTPPDQYTAAMARRHNRVVNARNERRRESAQYRRQNLAASSSAGTSTSGASARSALIANHGHPPISEQASTSLQPSGHPAVASKDSNEDIDWNWLGSYLHS